MKKKILILVITIIYLILISCCNYDSNNIRLRKQILNTELRKKYDSKKENK